MTCGSVIFLLLLEDTFFFSCQKYTESYQRTAWYAFKTKGVDIYNSKGSELN
jgi:hypothetical protein